MKTAAQAMELEAPALKAAKVNTKVNPRTMQKYNTNIETMSTLQIFNRVYHRHNTGLWMTANLVTLGVIIWQKIGG